MVEYRRNRVFGTCFTVTSCNAYKYRVLLTLCPHPGSAVESHQNIRYDDLQKFSGDIDRRLTAERGSSARSRGCRNKTMPINGFTLAGHKEVARLEHAAIVMGLGKSLFGISLPARLETEVVNIPYQYIVQCEHETSSCSLFCRSWRLANYIIARLCPPAGPIRLFHRPH